MLPTITHGPSLRLWRRSALPEIDRVFDDFFGRTPLGWSAWTPVADLYETDDGFALELEVPGFEKDEVEITVERGILTVSGERSADEESEEKGRTYHVRERSYERFTRAFSLPRSVNADAVKAELRSGVLHVWLPKLAEAKPRKIEVAVK
ncbi:MAG: Hsp20/alpha crystallin family protein [Gemmatimonadota bacterium]